MAALVAALLIRATDKSAPYVAAMAERTGRTGAVIAAMLVALLVTQAVAAVAGILIAPHLNLHAQRLLVGFALMSAGFGVVWSGKPIKLREGRHPAIHVAATLIAAGLGDRTQFATMAIAAGGFAGLAGAGGFIGGAAVLGAAALAGERLWQGLPHRPLSYAIGALLVVAGCWLAVSALRLI